MTSGETRPDRDALARRTWPCCEHCREDTGHYVPATVHQLPCEVRGCQSPANPEPSAPDDLAPGELPDAKWIYDDDPGGGGLTMFRSPTFTVPVQAKYYVMATADDLQREIAAALDALPAADDCVHLRPPYLCHACAAAAVMDVLRRNGLVSS